MSTRLSEIRFTDAARFKEILRIRILLDFKGRGDPAGIKRVAALRVLNVTVRISPQISSNIFFRLPNEEILLESGETRSEN